MTHFQETQLNQIREKTEGSKIKHKAHKMRERQNKMGRKHRDKRFDTQKERETKRETRLE